MKAFEVICDRCEREADLQSGTIREESRRELRRLARNAGWMITNKVQLCPDCAVALDIQRYVSVEEG